MTQPGGCSEGTAGSSACDPPSTVTDWNDMRRRDLEGNMLEIDDRLIS